MRPDFQPGLSGTDTSASTLGWVDRTTGMMAPLFERAGLIGHPRLSRDETSVAVSVAAGQDVDIWVSDERGTPWKLTSGGTNVYPVWAPDSTSLAFASDRAGTYDLYAQPLDGGGAEVLVETRSVKIPGSWSPNGDTLAYYEVNSGTGARDIWMLSPGRDPSPVVVSEFNDRAPQLSPDGHWLAYVSNRSGVDEVWVERFPDGGQRRQVSSDGGTEPVWSPIGTELFYRNGPRLLAASVDTREGFRPGPPVVLFEGPFDTDPDNQGNPNYDVSRDGMQFLMVSRPQGTSSTMTIVVNGLGDLAQRVPVP